MNNLRLQVERDDAIARAEAAEAALAAVPIAELRRIVKMHKANQWSSIEGPPLWTKVESWLKGQE